MEHKLTDKDEQARYERGLIQDAILQIVIGLLFVGMVSVFIASYFFIFR